MTAPARPSDTRLVRRAALVIAAQTAAAVAVVVAAVIVLVLVLTIREQHDDAERIVRTAAESATEVDNPPFPVALLIRDPDGSVALTPGAPTGLLDVDVAALPTGPSEITIASEGGHHDGSRYLVYVVDRDGERIVAALDSRYRASETERLVTSLIIAGLLGVAAAAAVGWLIGARAVRPLGSALALQRRFVADASHELRTPLTILHTRAQLIARRPDLDPRTRDDLDHLVDDTRVLADIVNDLLLSAEMQHRPGGRQQIDLGDLAREVAGTFAPAAAQAGVDLHVDVAPDAQVTVAGVPVALRRAVNALVDNALSHTHLGDTVTLQVTGGPHVTLKVIDNGDGLDPAEAAALTERFARGTRASGAGRFGLGLALVREVVEAHGGTLALTGKIGAGATATIILPNR